MAGTLLGKWWSREIKLRETSCTRSSGGFIPLSSMLLSLDLGYKILRGRTGNLEQSCGAGTWRKARNLLSNRTWKQGHDLRRLT